MRGREGTGTPGVRLSRPFRTALARAVHRFRCRGRARRRPLSARDGVGAKHAVEFSRSRNRPRAVNALEEVYSSTPLYELIGTMAWWGGSCQHLLRSRVGRGEIGAGERLMATGKKFERIADDLRAQIRAERLSPRVMLASENKLAREHATSVPTVRQALALLQAEGMIEKEHGRGNFVRRPRRLVSRSNERHQWEKDRVRAELEERSSTGATEHDTGLEVGALVFSAKY